MYRNYLKRLFDFVFALIVSIILIIPFIIVGLIIKVDSSGPVFFLQKRLGKDKKLFEVIKFRTMTHKKRTRETQVYKYNPEITNVGYYLRRFKIDEMPQIFNVLRGEMSIIGPRPCLPDVKVKFDLEGDYRFLVKPGLSSIAGVNGSIYLSWKEKWMYDKYYVDNLSFWLDVKIILKTLLVVIVGEEKFLKKPNR